MIKDNIEYNIIQPEESLADYIKFFWHLTNYTGKEKKVIILPDGYFDIIFYSFDDLSFRALLVGLSTGPSEYIIPPNAVSFAVSFKLLAAEYVLNTKMADLLNQQTYLPQGYWNIKPDHLPDFAGFANVVTGRIMKLVDSDIDNRKQKLFDLVYSTDVMATVQHLSNAAHWSSRQINRYFINWFGINLKMYCNILRYRASFKNLKEGKLFPEDHFSDQAHFIKEIKKFSGVTPKELAKNENDRFIQLSTLPNK